ncbi:hypothetical protein C8R46DRAFT_1297867 [Mycena filopes]|nr:hypothetical protein C8R46DRAFT_1297867 [Mycena filopes]
MADFRVLLAAPTLVPRLRTLSIRFGTNTLDYTRLVKSLTTRRHHNPELSSVRLDIHDYEDSDDGECDVQWLPPRTKTLLHDLLADGLQIQVNWTPNSLLEESEGWPERWVGWLVQWS